MSESTNNNSLQIPSQSAPAKQNENVPAPTNNVPVIEVPKLELDTTKKEKTMAEFLLMMDNYAPIVKFRSYSCIQLLIDAFSCLIRYPMR